MDLGPPDARFPITVECPVCAGRLVATVGPLNADWEPVRVECPYCERVVEIQFNGKLYSVEREQRR